MRRSRLSCEVHDGGIYCDGRLMVRLDICRYRERVRCSVSEMGDVGWKVTRMRKRLFSLSS